MHAAERRALQVCLVLEMLAMHISILTIKLLSKHDRQAAQPYALVADDEDCHSENVDRCPRLGSSKMGVPAAIIRHHYPTCLLLLTHF